MNLKNLPATMRGSFFTGTYWAAIGVYEPFFFVYLMNLGLDGRQVGLLGMLLPLAQVVFAPFYTGIADRIGQRRRLLALSLAAIAGVMFLFGAMRGGFSSTTGSSGNAAAFAAILLMVVLLALARSPSTGLGDGLLARMAVRFAVDYGRMRLFGSLGFAMACIGFGWVWERIGPENMFPVAGAAFLVVALSALLLEEDAAGAHQTRAPLKVIAANRPLLALLLATLVVGGALYLGITFTSPYMAYLGGGNALIGLSIGLSAITEMPAMMLAGTLVRRIGGLQTLLIGYGVLGFSFLAFAFAPSPLALLLINMLKGPGFGLFMAATVVLLEQNSPPGWTATVLTMMNAGAFGLAPLVSSPLGGLVYDLLGPRMVFVLAAVLVALAALVLALGYGRHARRSEAEVVKAGVED